MEVSYQTGEGKRAMFRLPNTIQDITVEVAAKIFKFAANNPYPTAPKTEDVPDDLDAFILVENHKKALDNWFFGFLCNCCLEGAVPATFNLAKYAHPQKSAEHIYTMFNKMLELYKEMLSYKPAPIKELAFKGTRYLLPAEIANIRTGRSVRSAAFAERLSKLAGGDFANIADLCAGILFTEEELDLEYKDIRKPIHNNVFDARAKLFLELPYTWAEDIAFFLLTKSKNYKRYLDMRSTQQRLIAARKRPINTKKQP